MPLLPRFSSSTTHMVPAIPAWDDIMSEFSSLPLESPMAPPFDSAKSTFSYQLRYQDSDSITNPEFSLCDLWCVSDKTCQVSMTCHMMAITVLVDTPLPLLLIVKEPPPIPVPASHQRLLSQHPEWSGPSPRYNYSLVASLKPGINHITWCGDWG
jgi:hypothetical protein